jgi:hypothetical protein
MKRQETAEAITVATAATSRPASFAEFGEHISGGPGLCRTRADSRRRRRARDPNAIGRNLEIVGQPRSREVGSRNAPARPDFLRISPPIHIRQVRRGLGGA